MFILMVVVLLEHWRSCRCCSCCYFMLAWTCSVDDLLTFNIVVIINVVGDVGTTLNHHHHHQRYNVLQIELLPACLCCINEWQMNEEMAWNDELYTQPKYPLTKLYVGTFYICHILFCPPCLRIKEGMFFCCCKDKYKKC